MGGKAKAPDYSSLANASKEAAQIMAGLGEKQLAESQRQYDLAFPFVQNIANTQANIQQQTADQGQDYFNYMKRTFRPVEERMVSDALAFNTQAKREELAQQAAADFGLAQQQAQASNERAMAAMGVNPNSGRFSGQQRASALQQAAGRANAMTGTRQQAEALGYARLADAVGMGRGLPGASAGAYQVATGAGNSAANVFQQPGQNLMAGMGQGAQTIGSGQSMYLGGLGTALNAQAQVYANQSDPFATILGAGLGAFGAFKSSKQAKTKEGAVDAQAVSRQVEGMPIDQWRYKPGEGDGGRHIGPYAEDMAKLGASDGRAIDVISALGLNLAAAKGLGQRLSKLERQGEKRHG